jgi:hypothetical protein
VENLCKNTARVIRPFFLGALRETWGVEKKIGGWEEQSSLIIGGILETNLAPFLGNLPNF